MYSLCKKKAEVDNIISSFFCHDASVSFVQLNAEVREASKKLKKARTILQLDELKCRKRVLRRLDSKQWCGIFGMFFNRLGYCNAADVIELKGRVACEIDA